MTSRQEASESKIADFFYEAGNLKRVKRSGWWLLGIKDPETVAEHSFRAAVIGYVLAKMESADSGKVTLMCLFNDLHEARLNDLHKLGQRYIDFKKAEAAAFQEQMKTLPSDVGDELGSLFSEFHEESTEEGRISRDADLLECALQAREYMKIGYRDAEDWLNNIQDLLRTGSAKRLFEEIKQTDPDSWWKGLKRISR